RKRATASADEPPASRDSDPRPRTDPRKSASKNGSSPKSGEGRPDLQEEVGVVPVAVGHPLDDLDLVVDAFDQIGSQRPAAVGQDPRQVGLEPPPEHAQRLQAAAQGSSLPALPRFPGPCLAPVAP